MTYYQYPLFGAKKIAQWSVLIFEGLLIALLALYGFQLALYVAYWTLYLNSVQLWTISNIFLHFTRVLAAFELIYWVLCLFLTASTLFALRRSFGEGLSSVGFLYMARIREGCKYSLTYCSWKRDSCRLLHFFSFDLRPKLSLLSVMICSITLAHTIYAPFEKFYTGFLRSEYTITSHNRATWRLSMRPPLMSSEIAERT